MKQKLIDRVIREGEVLTNRFRYICRKRKDYIEIYKVNLVNGERKIEKVIGRK